jgi:alpha-L-fucosidase
MRKVLILFGVFCLLSPGYAQAPESVNTVKVEAGDTDARIIEKAARVVPTANQLAALDREFIAFIHFGPNTFTRREWGNGMEDPAVFDLERLDTDQWCEAMKAAGMKMVVITAKHHDGFVLWQSRYTSHGVASTGFRDGRGDIMKDLSESCRRYGLKLGVYLSPADLYQIEHPDGLYGNLSPYTERTIPRKVPGRPFADQTEFRFTVDDYNEYFLNQLFELLTEYGPIHEVWFDGAHPKTKGGQRYNYAAWRELIRTLAPEANIFGREDIRWCGNEAGHTRDTEWNVIAAYTEDPRTMGEYMDLHGDLGSRDVLLGREKPYYLHYQPAETNTSIREGWFYRDETHQRTRSADDVFDIYERSVGGNSIFLLNIPPTREGVFSPVDVAVLKETGRRIDETYGHDLLEGAVMDRDAEGVVISAPEPITFNRIAIGEDIAGCGERVEKHAVDVWTGGQWTEIARATNIGHKRILRFPEVTTDRLRIRILEARLDPAISRVSAHRYRTCPPLLNVERDAEGVVTIAALSSDFDWSNWNNTDAANRRTGAGSQRTLPGELKIYYTTDGSEPDAASAASTEYTAPFPMESGELKAIAHLDGEKGTVHHERFGLLKKGWRRLDAEDGASLAIDLGKSENLAGFAYTPVGRQAKNMVVEGIIQTSDDGRRWKEADGFMFGNLVNDPTPRYHYFKKPLEARYVRILPGKIATNGTIEETGELDLYPAPPSGRSRRPR